MPVPGTYLLTAPAEVAEANPFGVTMIGTTLIEGLRRCNPNIVAPMTDNYTGWYPGQDGTNPVDQRSAPQTCLWLGDPDNGGLKITGLTLGAIPEWTQLDPKTGDIFAKGWRAIFARVVKIGAVSKARLEREFSVVLDVDATPERGFCPVCKKFGRNVRGTGTLFLCKRHERKRVEMRLPEPVRW